MFPFLLLLFILLQCCCGDSSDFLGSFENWDYHSAAGAVRFLVYVAKDHTAWQIAFWAFGWDCDLGCLSLLVADANDGEDLSGC